ncbi:uncharacterized protein yc1106_04112 [Curvularia clavata]|uniref:2-haloalkanoic acid dehalogenase n=1 Tax=Curvularia clavata TaxID=95742 RepID=A0A9Q9DQX1_CURCL|nr:uncharacterized protein yc1106_04112 [Curvularia clavata]
MTGKCTGVLEAQDGPMTGPGVLKKHVVFDIVGTCVSFDAFYSAIEATIGPKLQQNTITAQHFGFTWQTAAEIEFTFFSISGGYKPYKELLRGFFYRTLSLCGVKNPKSIFTDEEREKCVEGYSALQMRPGTHEAFQILRDNGFTVWALTTGDIQRVSGYFERANLHMPLENLVSCDSVGVAKPAPAAYRVMWDKLGENDIKWFAAGHMWDVTAATKVGFRGAWSAVYEHDPCLDIFNDAKLEVVEESLVDMAKAIVAKSA